MMKAYDKRIIERNFSRYAGCYDKYAVVQNFLASKLVEKIEPGELLKILDVGCDTGNYTKLLREKFPLAEIKAVDISREMIKTAKNKLKKREINFVIADAEKIAISEEFDLITSNASFQWFASLRSALADYRKLLRKNGVILFSIFGPRTLHELSASLKELFTKDAGISASTFVNKHRLCEVLKGIFKKTSIEEEIFEEKNDSLWQLLSKIKYTGTRGCGINGAKLRRAQINELEKIYKKRFGNLVATYQIFYCRAVK